VGRPQLAGPPAADAGAHFAEDSALRAAEAMAQARPCVATGVGGIARAVGDAAILVPPEDVPALAEALSALLRDEARRTELGVEHTVGRQRNSPLTEWLAELSAF
jgi:glycosyltransferase involved in cell wall biosynthesis